MWGGCRGKNGLESVVKEFLVLAYYRKFFSGEIAKFSEIFPKKVKFLALPRPIKSWSVARTNPAWDQSGLAIWVTYWKRISMKGVF